MTANITNDLGSNLEENLERWAKMLRHAGKNRTVFDAIYSSKKVSWRNDEIAAATGLNGKNASEAAKALHDRALLTRHPGLPIRYSKRPDVYREKRKLLTLADSPKKLAALPTKRRLQTTARSLRPNAMVGRAIHITVDDIDSFSSVKRITPDDVPQKLIPERLPEDVFKNGVGNILGERTRLKDWGGENLDLYSTNLTIKGKRRAVGIALKGPAKSGALTPGKMGKNGDQIDRLFTQAIDVAIVQYEGDIAISVPSLMDKLAREKARSEEKNIYYCLINLLDSYRLRLAYPTAFKAALKKADAKRVKPEGREQKRPRK
jgi:hypothetical protein